MPTDSRDHSDDAPKDGVLISRSDTKRDVGFDTLHATIGRLPPLGMEPGPTRTFKLELRPEDANSVRAALSKLATRFQKNQRAEPICHTSRGNRIRFQIETRVVAAPQTAPDGSDRDHLKRGERFKVELVIVHANARQTNFYVSLIRDSNGCYWLNVQANPTALLKGYNAFAVALPKVGRRAERRIMMRVPFAVLRQIVRSVEPEFEWQNDTKRRLKELAFRICPVQVFTYLVTHPRTPAQLMGFLRCVYSVPYSSGDVDRLLCDDLSFQLMSVRGSDSLQTLLFEFRTGGRTASSVNFYDKLAKAKVDAAVIDAKVGGSKDLKFLRGAVRVDITLHDAALRDMSREANLSTREDASVTAAEYCRAIAEMDARCGKSGKRFVQWLLDYIIEDRLKLWAMLNYKPSRLDRAQSMLSGYNADAAAGFASWRNAGFEHFERSSRSRRTTSFVRFLEFHATPTLSRDVARRTREKLLAVKLDPDIPLRAYDAFFERTFAWDLPDNRRHELAVALEARDFAAVGQVLHVGRRNSVGRIRAITTALSEMIGSAHTPASTLGVSDEED
jgi:hypothetical protein